MAEPCVPGLVRLRTVGRTCHACGSDAGNEEGQGSNGTLSSLSLLGASELGKPSYWYSNGPRRLRP